MSAANKTPDSPGSVARHSLRAAPGSAIDVAHQWLKKQCEDVNGHISTWPSETMDRYHRDLGLLVDFVTDCWPNVAGELRPPPENQR